MESRRQRTGAAAAGLTRKAAAILLAGLLGVSAAMPVQAAFEQTVETGYNTAVQGQDTLDGLDVTVVETTVSSKTNLSSVKRVDLKVTGIKADQMKADISVSTDETSAQSYYRDGWYYDTENNEKIKKSMSRDEIWKLINSHIYLDMNSSYLKMLYSQKDDVSGQIRYYFAATDETLGDYTEKLLDHFAAGQDNISIDNLQGSMTTDQDGHVLQREIRLVYTVGKDADAETFMKNVQSAYTQDGTVNVSLPDLSAYREPAAQNPVVTITPLAKTVYASTGINVRSAGSLDGTIIGGYNKADAITQTAVTSDGWVQVQYEGQTGYVWGEYVTDTRPVITSRASGTMYATADVNVRADHGVNSPILGVLAKGKGIEITGKTNIGWTKVNYDGHTGYISSNYLTDAEPIVDTYVKDAVVRGTVQLVTLNSITVRTWQGDLVFNTQYAEMNVVDEVQPGDDVMVIYEGSASPYTASAVTDEVNHFLQTEYGSYNEGTDFPELYTMDGVVTAISGNHMEMSCSDGIYRSFDLSDADLYIDRSQIKPGSYLAATWESTDGAETDDIAAVEVS